MNPDTRTRKFWQFPLTRIVVGGGCWSAVYGLSSAIMYRISAGRFFSPDPDNFVFATVIPAFLILTYYVFTSRYEKRELPEMLDNHIASHLLWGLLAGFAVLSVIVAVMLVFGDYKVLFLNHISFLVPGISIAVLSSISEEILFRGILFRITEEWGGSVTALAVTCVLFGAVHLTNPGCTILSVLNISVAGLLLGACYMWSRSLWMPVALHFSWNLAEAGIYGLPVSGYSLTASLLSVETHGSPLITGGAFGPEASIPCLVVESIAAVVFLYYCKKGNRVVSLYWPALAR